MEKTTSQRRAKKIAKRLKRRQAEIDQARETAIQEMQEPLTTILREAVNKKEPRIIEPGGMTITAKDLAETTEAGTTIKAKILIAKTLGGKQWNDEEELRAQLIASRCEIPATPKKSNEGQTADGAKQTTDAKDTAKQAKKATKTDPEMLAEEIKTQTVKALAETITDETRAEADYATLIRYAEINGEQLAKEAAGRYDLTRIRIFIREETLD